MQRLILLLFVFIFASISKSHPGGHGPEKTIFCEVPESCTRAEAEQAGARILEYILEANQLEISWANSQRVGNARQVSVADMPAWVVEFKNSEITESTKQNLYIVISNDGYLIGTTYDKSRFQENNISMQLIGLAVIIGISLAVWFAFLRKPKRSNVT